MEQKYRALLLENIDEEAKRNLETKGFEVVMHKDSMGEDDLIKNIKNVHILGIRSKTKITKNVLEHAKELLCIGCYCIGTNNVELDVAQNKGIPVFNSPYANSRSVAENIIAQIINLARQFGDRNMEMHKGIWNKKSKGCYEIRGKILGIIGYGNIGKQLSVLAESMGMKVIFYDILNVMPLGNSKRMGSLEGVLESSDFVTLHVPETDITKNMIKKRELQMMKKGSYLLNASRGSVVNIDDLVEYIKIGHIAGSYIDVFPEEPLSNTNKWKTELQNISNVIMTPHIGGSTEEAQEAIARDVSDKIIKYIKTGCTMYCVNFPETELVYGGPTTHRVLNIHYNKRGVLKEINNILSVYNVESQILKTSGSVGYLIADVDAGTSEEIKDKIDKLTYTIKTRILY